MTCIERAWGGPRKVKESNSASHKDYPPDQKGIHSVRVSISPCQVDKL